jgi:Membrane-fusion protein
MLHVRIPVRDWPPNQPVERLSLKTPKGYRTLKQLGGRLLAQTSLPQADAPYRSLRALVPAGVGVESGEYVEVLLEGPPNDSVLAVGRNSLMESFGHYACYVQVTGESFTRRTLKLGASLGDSVQVLKGLKPGERIVSQQPALVRRASQATAPAHTH